jgi:hypothetical protein
MNYLVSLLARTISQLSDELSGVIGDAHHPYPSALG